MPTRNASICFVAAAALLTACGSSPPAETNGSGDYTVAVPTATFPASQRIDSGSVMRIDVTNSGPRALPNVAVSLTTDSAGTSAPAFAKPDSQQGLAQAYKSVWIIDEGPVGGASAFSNTWTLGNLPAGATKTFTWRVHPVRGGAFKIHWKVAPSTNGGKAVFADGAPAEGVLAASISTKPPTATVAPSGRVEKQY